MRKIPAIISIYLVVLFMVIGSSGCTVIFQKGRKKDIEKLSSLQNKVNELEQAKAELENRLRSEIDGKDVTVKMMERGLVITFLAEVLFDSGKAILKEDALGKVDKIAKVLMTTVRDLKVGIEGHTDNQPIKYSGWKSNWELSSARAMSVLHYLIDEHDIDPARLSATGYGEHQPVDTNDTPEGRQQNRRVEIVIYPKISKEAAAVEPEENLK